MSCDVCAGIDPDCAACELALVENLCNDYSTSTTHHDTTEHKMSHTFSRNDVVEYKTGKTYLVGFQRSPETLEVSGWKNGKCYGPSRYLDPADCKLIGRRVPINDGAAWGFEPLK